MSQQLSTIIQQADDLPVEEQLTLLAHLKERIEANKAQKNNGGIETESSTDSLRSDKSIRQILDDFSADLSEEAFDQIPSDGAVQHDHYIYGTTKTQS